MKFAQIAKRVLLFMAVNVLVLATISLVLALLSPWLSHFQFHGHSVNSYYGNLLIFCFIWGMAGENQVFDDMDAVKPGDLR